MATNYAKWKYLLLVFFSIIDFIGSVDVLLCQEGYKLYTPKSGEKDTCIPCENETFMPHNGHKHRQCYNCLEVTDEERERIVSECSKTHDAIIECYSEYYRIAAENSTSKNSICVNCTVCNGSAPFPILPCQEYNDTVCCPERNHTVHYNTKDGKPECKMESCGSGTYLNKTAEKCVPCPDGTFMSSDGHSNSKCVYCSSSYMYSGTHLKVKTPCNKTHDVIFECETGYFNEGSDSDGKPTCHPASKNESSSPTDAQLTTPSPGWRPVVCPENHYLDTGNATCTPCSEGTFLNETNHTKTACQNSPNVQGRNSTDKGIDGAAADNQAWPTAVGVIAIVFGIIAIILGLIAIILGIIAIILERIAIIGGIKGEGKRGKIAIIGGIIGVLGGILGGIIGGILGLIIGGIIVIIGGIIAIIILCVHCRRQKPESSNTVELDPISTNGTAQHTGNQDNNINNPDEEESRNFLPEAPPNTI